MLFNVTNVFVCSKFFIVVNNCIQINKLSFHERFIFSYCGNGFNRLYLHHDFPPPLLREGMKGCFRIRTPGRVVRWIGNRFFFSMCGQPGRCFRNEIPLRQIGENECRGFSTRSPTRPSIIRGERVVYFLGGSAKVFKTANTRRKRNEMTTVHDLR